MLLKISPLSSNSKEFQAINEFASLFWIQYVFRIIGMSYIFSFLHSVKYSYCNGHHFEVSFVMYLPVDLRLI